MKISSKIFLRESFLSWESQSKSDETVDVSSYTDEISYSEFSTYWLSNELFYSQKKYKQNSKNSFEIKSIHFLLNFSGVTIFHIISINSLFLFISCNSPKDTQMPEKIKHQLQLKYSSHSLRDQLLELSILRWDLL